jgi:hypothetical protein
VRPFTFRGQVLLILENISEPPMVASSIDLASSPDREVATPFEDEIVGVGQILVGPELE